MDEKPLVLFETEGSYPYHGGGVSTWAHTLCQELEKRVDFTIFTLTGSPFVELRYRLPDNIKNIIQVPLWGAEEPVQYFNSKVPFSEHISRKARTTNDAVKKYFFPMFRDFIAFVLDPFGPVTLFGQLIYGFWRYYQHFDYKQTLANPLLWAEFKHKLTSYLEQDQAFNEEMPRVFDVTFGMRWLYHFMMPLAAPLPRASLTHATLAGFPALASIAAKFEYGTPMMVTDHGVFIRERLINVGQSDYPFFSKRMLVNLSTFITRATYYYADLIAPVTTINEKWEVKFEGRKEHIAPIYNGINPDIFRPTAKPSKTANRPTVVAAAQIFPLKDIETMIRSCHFVRQKIPDVHYILYGSLQVDPAYAEKCKKLVKELNLQDNFTFGGFHNTPSMIYNEGDISILSSISEGFPYTVIESMSCRRPVVSTDVGGVSEALEGCGILCKPRHARGLAEGVIKLLNNDQLRIEWGRKGRERVILKYTLSQSVDNYFEVYKKFHHQARRPLKDDISLPSVKQLIKHLDDA